MHLFVLLLMGAPIPNSLIRLCLDPCNDKLITYFDSICFQDDGNINFNFDSTENFFVKNFQDKNVKQKLRHQVVEAAEAMKAEAIQKLTLPQSWLKQMLP